MVRIIFKLAFVFIPFATSFCYLLYFKYATNFQPIQFNENPVTLQPASCANPHTIPLPTGENKKSELIVLLWTWPHGHRFPLNQCMTVYGIAGCHLTDNRSWYEHADAVILHHRDVSFNASLLPPEPRPARQRWLWFNMEPPIHLQNLQIMDNLINLTMSYRRDSDVFSPYGWMEHLEEPENFTIPARSKLVCWVVSNWRISDRRVQYYNELQEHIPIDVFGRTHRAVPDDNILPTIGQYKFYLAFENCQHTDYITEKLWRNAFASMTVPIVLGPPRENYELFLPPDSFIHVDDFATVKDLAAYLRVLDADAVRYEHYFDWRHRLRAVWRVSWLTHYCKACKALHQGFINHTVPSIEKWFI